MTEIEFNQCVDRYADGLYRFIVKNLKHPEDAKDIVQNSFEILWTHRDGLQAGKAKAYLFTTGYRNMIDHLRKTSRINLMEEFPENLPADGRQEPDLKAVLMAGLARLSTVQRSVVLLKDYEGYSYEEIGAITGLNASQVKVYLHRARLKMKAYLVKRTHLT